MYIHIFILSALLFFVLSPTILLTLSPNSSKYIVALVHAIVFGGFLAVILKYYNDSLLLQEGAKGRKKAKKSTTYNSCKKECKTKVKEKYNCNNQKSKCRRSYKKCKREKC